METFTYPKASLLPLTCQHCGAQKPKRGGYRRRKLRDIAGVREVKVMKVRCRDCRRQLMCLYPPGVLRYRWYSSKLEGIFAILDVHQVDEACSAEVAEMLGYPLRREIRASWEARRALRAERLQASLPQGQRKVASIDEFKLGSWWVYTLVDAASQVVVRYALSETRDGAVVRDAR